MCILEFSNLLFLLELIVLHRGAHVIGVGGILWMEHVGTEVQNGLLVAAFVIAFADLLHAEGFDELGNPVDEVGGVDGLGESLLGEVAEANQAVNEHRSWQFGIGLVDQGQKGVHRFKSYSFIGFQHLQSGAGVQDVGKECRAEIQAENMNAS